VGSCRIDIESNSTALVGGLERYFEPFLAQEGGEPDIRVTAIQAEPPAFPVHFEEWKREPGKRRKEEFADVEGGRIVRKVRTGMVFLVGARDQLAVGDCLRNDNQVVNFVNFQYTSWLLERGFVLCHAAGVVRDGRGLAIAASSGGGKSTLALHLMSCGLDFASNDRLLVRHFPEGARMSGIPKLPRINPGTILGNPDLRPMLPGDRKRELEEVEEDELWELEEKYDVMIDEVFGERRIELEAPLEAFLVLNWERESAEPMRIRRVDLGERRDLLRAIMKPAGPFHVPEGRPVRRADLLPAPEKYLEQLVGVAAYEASGRVDFEAAAALCLARVLDEKGPP
jgi:HprK-related kinase B